MINKIQKIINNKFSGFFKFVFFLRYLFLIFFVSILLFLLIPYFFDYKKKYLVIDSYMSNNYGLDIKNIDNIEYNEQETNILVSEINDNQEYEIKKFNNLINPDIMVIF